MESRRLIKFGGNSFVVSIPKSWISQNQLKKGDLVFLKQEADSLVLNSSGQQVREIRKAILTVDNKPLRRIHTELTSLYLQGYDIIEMRGTSIEKNAPQLKQLMKYFVGMELMEETTKKIVVKDLVDIKEVSVRTLIRRIDVIIRAMLTDTITCFEEDHYESINQRDNDVNRFVYLLKRIIRQAVERRDLAVKLDTTRIQLIKNMLIVGYLESVGDCTKRIARSATMEKIKPQYKKEMKDILTQYNEAYLQIMKAYHTANIDTAFDIEMGSKERLQLCEDLERTCNDAPTLIYNLKRTNHIT